ncbi:ABC-type lipoprotein release transport system permease subunit [Chitinophaga dinghuensis]|uniref:ABC-type lipoprotein release transport system permease subunit n=1 Tax=Chitinophaga dinghuensis TaxID=1539050 RepID=A0A327VXZ8_9BACT|nr:ABC transporter permease [Chitinophaga dinghuensis]RAJ81911.1 ABC-type lipoprotein release transport system permease subunit [Chitinophaga dinghuensis]
MFRNYFSIAIRNLFRNKGFSSINIGGLAIGMASAILILLWVQHETSYDRFHQHADRLYQVWSNDSIAGKIRSMTMTPEIMAPTLKTDFPEVEGVTRVRWTRNLLALPHQEVKLLSNGAVVDQDFLAMFSFPLLTGNSKTVLKDPSSIVLAERLAKKLFKNENPIGQVVSIGQEGYTVSGVLQDLPDNTQFSYIDYLISYDREVMAGNIDKDWTNFSISTFVLLRPNMDAAVTSNKIKHIVAQHSVDGKTEEFLYPFSRTRLYDHFENGVAIGGRITTVRTFFLVAVFILLIACINFMNLATARSNKRAKEVGVRKAIGAAKGALILQFLTESLLLACIAGLFAWLIVVIALPYFNTLTGKQLHIAYTDINSWLSAAGFILLTGLLAGSYPAFYLSAFKPLAVLKGLNKIGNTLITPRRVLVVLQFSFAIVLIICTIIVTRQIQYGKARKTGLDMNNLVHVYLNDEMDKNFQLIKQELIASGYATSVAKVLSPLSENWAYGLSLSWPGKPAGMQVQINRFTEEGDLVKTAGMRLISGRDIDLKTYPTDSTACLINESAAKLMGFEDPIGKEIYDDPDRFHIVGVIEDFIQESPYMPVHPIVIKGPKNGTGTILIKLNAGKSLVADITGMEQVFKKYNPAYPLEYKFSQDAYAAKFGNENLTAKLAGLFAGLTIFISCLGLFGLAAFMAESRFKEIGIRKVLGASAANITVLLSKDFIQLVIIAVFIASPLAYWMSNRWLQDFYYRINPSIWIFITAGTLAVLIALLTVSSQAIKAAMTNPAKSLKTE